MKILIIKLGAKGDVVRTLPVLQALREKYPDSEITWLTKPSSLEIVRMSPYVNKVLSIPYTENLSFDVLYNFDIDDLATSLAMQISAKKKLGFSNEGGYTSAFNLPAEYYLNTLFDDKIKKENTKTYQQMMFDAAELPYNHKLPIINLSSEDKKYAEDFVTSNSLNIEKLVGLHIGSSPRWPSKSLSSKKIEEFIIAAKQEGYDVLLLAGPDDIEKQKTILESLKQQGIDVKQNNPQNSDKQFISLVNLCKFMVCSDSYALHVSLALKKPTIALFFCTTPYEVEGYGLLTKIVSPMLYEFFPEKQDQFSEQLVNSITVEQVLKALNSMK